VQDPWIKNWGHVSCDVAPALALTGMGRERGRAESHADLHNVADLTERSRLLLTSSGNPQTPPLTGASGHVAFR